MINSILNFVTIHFLLYKIKDSILSEIHIPFGANLILTIFIVECLFHSYHRNWKSKYKNNYFLNKLIGY